MPPVRRVKKSKTRKTGEHVPRPPNSFMLFRSWASQNLPEDIEDVIDEIRSKPRPVKVKGKGKEKEIEMKRPNRNSALSIYLGARWREMDDDEREIWETKAREAKDAHERRYPDYKYQPTRKACLKSEDESESEDVDDSEVDVSEGQPVAGPSTLVPMGGSGRGNHYPHHYPVTVPLQPYANQNWVQPPLQQGRPRVGAEPYTLHAYYHNPRYSLPQEWMAWDNASRSHSGAQQTFQTGWNNSTWASGSHATHLPAQQFEGCVTSDAGHASTSGGSEDLFEGSEYGVYDEDGYSVSTASYPSSSAQVNPHVSVPDLVSCHPPPPGTVTVDDTRAEGEDAASESAHDSDSMYAGEDYAEDFQLEGIAEDTQEVRAPESEPVFRWSFNFDEDDTSWRAERDREVFRRWLSGAKVDDQPRSGDVRICNTEWVFPPYEGN
ncbi:hypothetical protein D9613_006428 [Agrocybe pediades]|uniref:HMG box domain-containing protein n=1 Tax=Agrocybe pediades TaxID=84607 RepID=A0A8H4QTM9_9AGAR|nr:hypothetical protein D9613_006428 [Agrocybe pediades]